MTEGIMTTEEFVESKQGWSGRKNTWIGLATIVVLIIVGVAVGVVVGGNNKEDPNPQQQSSSSSLSNTDLENDDGEDRLVASSAPSSMLSPTDRPSEESSTGPTFAATDSPSSSSPTVAVTTNPPVTLPPSTTVVTNTDSPGTIISGTTIGGMPYLRCSSENNDDTAADAAAQKQVVLLHGSSFTKETWEEHDMLPQFCNGAEMVVALDFPVSTNYQGLMQVLDDLGDADNETGRAIITKPVTLVTPSASGFSVVSWIMGGDVTMLPSYIAEWVPVATGSLVSASDEQIGALKDIPGFAILAINGNEDQAGGKYSTRLADLAGATAVELTGRHAVYLQSPDEFVQTILDFVP